MAPAERPPQLLLSIERALARLELGLVAAGLVTMLAVALVEIVARNFFNIGIPGAETLLRHLVLWVALLGAALAVRDERHIRIDLTAVWLSAAWRARLARVFHFLTAGVCVLLFMAAQRFWREEWGGAGWSLEKSLSLVLPVSFFLLALQFSVRGLLGTRRE